MQQYANNLRGHTIGARAQSQVNIQGIGNGFQRQTNGNGMVYMMHPRVSTVSSQKKSIATRADQFTNSTVLSNYTPRRQTIGRTGSERNISTPIMMQSNVVIQNNPLVLSSVYQINEHSRVFSQNQFPISVAYGIPSASQQTISSYSNPYRQSTFTNQHLNTSLEISKVLPNPSFGINSVYMKPEPTKNPLLVASKNNHIPSNSKIQSKNKSTVVRDGTPIVGKVTVQNIQLPPRIRNPPKRLNDRLYKSAVYGRSIPEVRPSSRAHSTISHRGKSKKRDVYIRCPHRAFISDKKIPVVGGYVSNDKSKSFVVRQVTGIHKPKVLTTRVVGMQLVDVIPTEIVKIPIGKAEELKQSRLDGSIMFDDMNSFYENHIIDQPGLIKQYSPQKSIRSFNDRKNHSSLDQSFLSLRSKRLGDNIKISVYRSPDVVVKKAEKITTGPKLTKQHILRVATEGKVVSAEKYSHLFNKSDLSQKSQSPAAKYDSKEYNLNSNTPSSNPYVKKDISDLLQRIKKQTSNLTNQHSYCPNPTLNIPSSSSPKIQTQTCQSPIKLIQSQSTPYSPYMQTSTFTYQPCIKQLPTKTSLISQSNIEQTPSLQKSPILSTHNNNIYNQPLHTLFQPISQTTTTQNTQLYEFQQTLRYLSQTKYTYTSTQLSEELEADLRKLKERTGSNSFRY